MTSLPDTHIYEASNGWVIAVSQPTSFNRSDPGSNVELGRYVARSLAELNRTIARIYVNHKLHDVTSTRAP